MGSKLNDDCSYKRAEEDLRQGKRKTFLKKAITEYQTEIVLMWPYAKAWATAEVGEANGLLWVPGRGQENGGRDASSANTLNFGLWPLCFFLPGTQQLIISLVQATHL